jgi:hypothetical protein
MELLDPIDPHAPNLWQCFLKILTKNGTVSDDARLEILALLLRHSSVAIRRSHPHDITKWLQYIRALLKMSKYALKRNAVSDKSIPYILELIQAVEGHEIIPDLLALPVKKPCDNQLDLTRIAETFLGKVQGMKMAFPFGSLGAIILATAMNKDLIQGLFDQTDPMLSAKCWVNQSPRTGHNIKNVSSWLDMCCSNWLISNERKWNKAVKTIVMLLFRYSSHKESIGSAFPLLGCTLRRILMFPKAPKLELSGWSTLERFIITAHLPGNLLAQSPRELPRTVEVISKILTETNLDPMLIFWPLAALTNICTEASQPSNCQETRRIVELVLNKIPGDAVYIKALCAKALRSSLKYCEATHLGAIQLNLDRLHPQGALSLIAALPFVPNWSIDQAGWTLSIEKSLLKCAPPTEMPNTTVLRHCEVFLRFATDLSVFESLSLSHLQGALVAFLQREQGTVPDCGQVVKSLEGALQRELFTKVPMTRIRIPPHRTLTVDTGSVEALLSQLDISLASLKDNTPEHHSVLVQLQGIINKYMQ